jgi:hypothetical protein
MTLSRVSFQGYRRGMWIGEDPFLEDPGLEKLLDQLESINNDDELAKWRVSVLGKYEAFVEPKGIEIARQAEERLVEKLKQFTETVKTVEKEIENGSYRSDHVNVTGNTALKFLKLGATESKSKYTSRMLIRSHSVGSLYCFLILDGHNSDSNDFRICSCHSSK